MTKIIIEVQHFEGCPNSDEMIRRVKEAIETLQFIVEYKEILVETPELAEKLKFRGSPTVLINGKDLENMEKPGEGNLSCRYYENGIPSAEEIKKKILNHSTEC